MAEIRAGYDRKLDRPVAIKRLKKAYARNDAMRKCFINEALLAARVTHPNVLPVYDTGEVDGIPHIVMERLSGATLADELLDGRISIDRARSIALQCLAGLDAAHRAGILHLDIKPANILLSDLGHAKLTDFGIAKITEGLQPHKVRRILGTPMYLAPERVDGKPATAASDLYAMAVVLYELLTGQSPYPETETRALLKAIRRDIPTHVRRLRPDVNPDFADAVMRGLQKDPAARFESAAEMRAAIQGDAPEYRRTLAPGVKSGTWLVPLPARLPRVNKLVAISALSAAAVAAAFVALPSVPFTSATPAAAVAAESSPSPADPLEAALSGLTRVIDQQVEDSVRNAQLQQFVVALHNASTAGDQGAARSTLQDFRLAVQGLRSGGFISLDGAGALLNAATDVEAHLGSIRPPATTTTIKPASVPPVTRRAAVRPTTTSTTSAPPATAPPTTVRPSTTTTITAPSTTAPSTTSPSTTAILSKPSKSSTSTTSTTIN